MLAMLTCLGTLVPMCGGCFCCENACGPSFSCVDRSLPFCGRGLRQNTCGTSTCAGERATKLCPSMLGSTHLHLLSVRPQSQLLHIPMRATLARAMHLMLGHPSDGRLPGLSGILVTAPQPVAQLYMRACVLSVGWAPSPPPGRSPGLATPATAPPARRPGR